MKYVAFSCIAIVALSITVPAGAVTPSIKGLGYLPASKVSGDSAAEEISADGTTVVGYNYNNDQTGIFRWTDAGGMVEIVIEEHSMRDPFAISADGSAIFGTTSDCVGLPNVFRWTQNNGKEILWSGGYAWDVSYDGSILVGDYRMPDNTYQASRWTAGQGNVGLGFLGDYNNSSATGISADGSVIVGISGDLDGGELFRWTAGNGMVSLGTLPGAAGVWDPAISADSSVIAGESGGELFRWTADEGMVNLGNLPGSEDIWVRDMSADGSIIVGTSNWEGFVWDAANGIQTIDDYLIGHGVDIDGWSFRRVSGISADGMVLVGAGNNPTGWSEAWVATIPEPTSLALLALGGLAVIKRRK